MRCMVLGAYVLLACVPALAADDKPGKKDLSPADEVKKLIEDYQLDQQEFSKLLRQAKSDADRSKIQNEKAPKPDKVAKRLLELAENHPKDKGVVPAAPIWVAKFAPAGSDGAKSKDKALELLLNHVHSPQVADLCLNLSGYPSPSGEKLMRAVLEKGPSNDAKGKAAYSLGKYLKNTAEIVRMLKEQPSFLDAMHTKEVIKHLRDSDPEAMTKEAEKMFNTAAKRYADVRVGSRPLAEMAESELFELRNLAIGKTAPQIEGVDLDGKKFKLSEYRGKVVVLDFWGNW